jgi:hypothetical protein
MNKKITKNVRYDKYNNYCVNEKGADLPNKKIGNQSLNSCLAKCARKATVCSGVEYYPKKYLGAKCFHIDAGLGDKRAAKGASGKRNKDATCYVRG